MNFWWVWFNYWTLYVWLESPRQKSVRRVKCVVIDFEAAKARLRGKR